MEEERNLNASFSRKPFKTASLVRLAPPVPHNFGVNKKKKKDDEEDENDALNEDPMIGVSARERQAFMRTAIKRKILDLKLGKLVRNEYGAQEKEKFLAGHFCYQNGNISVVGDRIQIRKSLAAMRSWSKKIFTDLAEDWPNLKFKIMLQNTVKTKKKGIGGFGKKIDLEGSGLTNFGSPSTQSFLDADGALRRPEEGADELLVQFETEGQSLPPEEALNR